MDEMYTQNNHRIMRGAAPEGVLLKDLHDKGITVFGRSGEHLIASLRKMGLLTASSNDRNKIYLTRPLNAKKNKKKKPVVSS
mmetsp:Transcript_1337/g.2257  ORF Transcript_1337/g.2257 Transcript_1337/m.2257 type:complete len:82 (+) Transcript_1337:870-1115(+)